MSVVVTIIIIIIITATIITIIIIHRIHVGLRARRRRRHPLQLARRRRLVQVRHYSLVTAYLLCMCSHASSGVCCCRPHLATALVVFSPFEMFFAFMAVAMMILVEWHVQAALRCI